MTLPVLFSRRFVRLNGAALLVGLLVGFAVVFFRWGINLVEQLSFGLGPLGTLWQRVTAQERNQFFVSPWGALVILVPALGGVVVGLIRHFRPDTKQQGVAEVMAAVQARGGVLRGSTSIGHAVISAVTVGTGGSTGREGPISYIGAAVGSTIGRRLSFNARDLKVLVGCGFAAGIGATFNAALGGTLLALELIVPEFSTHAFIPIVAASVLGTTVAHQYLGGSATFEMVPHFQFHSLWELLLYLLLGLVCGLAGVAFIRILADTSRAWARSRMAAWLKPALGGLLVGIMGYVMLLSLHHYHLFGSGYATITDILQSGSTLAWVALLVLVVAKPVATSITIGAGGGGGVFSASLYMGAAWGGLVGLAAAALFPGSHIDPASYALVGMGAFYAATARATLTAIVIVAELTNDFTVMLPLMLAAVTADAVSVGLSRDSVYTVRLSDKGILYEHDRRQSALDLVRVKDIMNPKVDTLPASMTVGDAFNRMLDLGHTGYPITDPQGRLLGVVTRRDMSRHLQEGRGQSRLVDVVSGAPVTAQPEEILHRARDRMFARQVGRLVVVDPADPQRIMGMLTRSDLLRAEAERDADSEAERVAA
ncbi:MAG: chloride channel protein [Thermoplasmatota archaeon]